MKNTNARLGLNPAHLTAFSLTRALDSYSYRDAMST